jgi:heme exporter protein C
MKDKAGSSILLYLTGGLILTAIYLAFLYAPTEKTMGDVQRIFYFHVPSAWIAFLAFGITFVCGLMFLIRKDLKWDNAAGSSAEIGLLFCTIALLTGSIWGRYAWGVWWAWDARLTSTLVLWLIYTSYKMLRSYIEEPNKRAYLSAVVGTIGFLDVPIVFFSIRWWRTQHPQPFIGGGEENSLEPAMLFTLLFSITAFTFLFSYMLKKRIAIEKMREEVDYLYKVVEQK